MMKRAVEKNSAGSRWCGGRGRGFRGVGLGVHTGKSSFYGEDWIRGGERERECEREGFLVFIAEGDMNEVFLFVV